MTKGKRKSNIKKKIKKKLNNKRKCYYIKDKAIINFILEHSKKPDIDFSKIKIPSFMDITNHDFPENQKENKDTFISNKLIMKEVENKEIIPNSFMKNYFPLIENEKFWFINNNNNESKIKSFLFN